MTPTASNKMRRFFWMILSLSLFAIGGCVDLDQNTERECLAERRCGPSEADVCGVDGEAYECAAQAQCYGVEIDQTGDSCGWAQPICPGVACDLYCANGYKTDENGCEICECKDQEPSECGELACNLGCPNGYKTGDDGCPICECRDEPQPCPAIACNNDCPNGYKTDENGCQTCECKEEEPACEDVACTLFCANGFKTDENGCEICECREPAATCEDDPCIADYCGSSRGTCYRASELANAGACPAPLFKEPAPECVCGEDTCYSRECASDADCDGGLCVRTPLEDRAGYCVESSCNQIMDRYDTFAQRHNSCQDDTDCQMVRTVPQCCTGYAVNQTGVNVLQEMDDFVAQTSCGVDFEEQCAMVDCVPVVQEVSCIDNRCVLGRR